MVRYAKQPDANSERLSPASADMKSSLISLSLSYLISLSLALSLSLLPYLSLSYLISPIVGVAGHEIQKGREKLQLQT